MRKKKILKGISWSFLLNHPSFLLFSTIGWKWLAENCRYFKIIYLRAGWQGEDTVSLWPTFKLSETLKAYCTRIEVWIGVHSWSRLIHLLLIFLWNFSLYINLTYYYVILKYNNQSNLLNKNASVRFLM